MQKERILERGAKQDLFDVQVHTTFNYRKESCRVLFRRKLTTKMPKLVNVEEEEVFAVIP